jgi:hypothetical protein
MANNIFVTVVIEQGRAGEPRYIHIPKKYASTPGITFYAGKELGNCYATYLSAAEVLQIPGAFCGFRSTVPID